ncbi:2-hydroxychromene-2-carboxylate isomerase [Algihabitans albus]|uniref:2-hydroxychromene-2-carboxylate isomerase n=1 Tax=Algihabitans albus TaxID=2164067 RepID=UPI000E5C992E|nr:2-hydroxychromene-2-carboxylate isomerase [Algihabitans albus]
MNEPLVFYFDFSSPYGFLAAREIGELAARHGREVTWKPMLLGAVFKQNGMQPLMDIPLKGDYARRDLSREARRVGIDFRLPDSFPFASIAAARAFYWLWDRDPAAARDFGLALFERAFIAGQDISKSQSVLSVGEARGMNCEELEKALQDPALKDRLRREVEGAIAAGVFGSPFVLVDGEPFWGYDRFPRIEGWLETGGW